MSRVELAETSGDVTVNAVYEITADARANGTLVGRHLSIVIGEKRYGRSVSVKGFSLLEVSALELALAREASAFIRGYAAGKASQ